MVLISKIYILKNIMIKIATNNKKMSQNSCKNRI